MFKYCRVFLLVISVCNNNSNCSSIIATEMIPLLTNSQQSQELAIFNPCTTEVLSDKDSVKIALQYSRKIYPNTNGLPDWNDNEYITIIPDNSEPVLCARITDKNRNFIIFRGSTDGDDWSLNANLSLNSKGFHYGFYKRAETLVAALKTCNTIGNSEVFFVGHSLGGAVATIAAKIYADELQYQCATNRIKVIAFCAPKLGSRRAVIEISKTLGIKNIVTFIHKYDLVPRLPFAYHRAGYEAKYTRSGDGANLLLGSLLTFGELIRSPNSNTFRNVADNLATLNETKVENCLRTLLVEDEILENYKILLLSLHRIGDQNGVDGDNNDLTLYNKLTLQEVDASPLQLARNPGIDYSEGLNILLIITRDDMEAYRNSLVISSRELRGRNLSFINAMQSIVKNLAIFSSFSSAVLDYEVIARCTQFASTAAITDGSALLLASISKGLGNYRDKIKADSVEDSNSNRATVIDSILSRAGIQSNNPQYTDISREILLQLRALSEQSNDRTSSQFNDGTNIQLRGWQDNVGNIVNHVDRREYRSVSGCLGVECLSRCWYDEESCCYSSSCIPLKALRYSHAGLIGVGYFLIICSTGIDTYLYGFDNDCGQSIAFLKKINFGVNIVGVGLLAVDQYLIQPSIITAENRPLHRNEVAEDLLNRCRLDDDLLNAENTVLITNELNRPSAWKNKEDYTWISLWGINGFIPWVLNKVG